MNKHLFSSVLTALCALACFSSPALGQTVVNSSFEADVSSGGSIGPISGWFFTAGSGGVNDSAGPFADNGTIPDGTKVAFIHFAGTLRQTVTGFTTGQQYQLSYYENSRTGNAPTLQVSVGGVIVLAAHSVPAVGGTNPYTRKVTQPFTASATSLAVDFAVSGSGDFTVLLDKVQATAAVLAPPGSIVRDGGDMIVGFNATQGINYRLERKLSLLDSFWQTAPGNPDLAATASGPAQFRILNAVALGKAFYHVTLPAVLTVERTGFGGGTVTSNVGGISCPNTCGATYDTGTVVTLSATPRNTSVAFTGWSGPCTGTGPCTVTMDQAKTVTANFNTLTCDGSLGGSPLGGTDFAKAIDLCSFEPANPPVAYPGVISVSYLTPDGNVPTALILTDMQNRQASARSSFGTNNLALLGSRLAVLSTGIAAAPGQTNPAPSASPFPGTSFTSNTAGPVGYAAANGGVFPRTPGCPTVADTQTHDGTMLRLRIRVPQSANSFSVKALFLTAEYPNFVCTPSNDMFLALLTSTWSGTPANPTDKNIARYNYQGTYVPFAPTLAFHNQGPPLQCISAGSTTCAGTAGLNGTGYEGGFGTSWLVVRGNVVPGEVITLDFTIFDAADHQTDSTVLLDAFEWSTDTITPGATPL